MVRLLVGVPLRSDGQLTIKSLAEEAGLRRNKLTHKHTGLKDLFYALARSQNHRPRSLINCRPTTTSSARNSPTSAPNTPDSKSRSRPTPASSTSWKSKTSYASKARPTTSSAHCNDKPADPRTRSTQPADLDSRKQSFITNTPRLDTEEDIRDLPLYLNPHLLDWLHVTMRITVMTTMAKSLRSPPPDPDLPPSPPADLATQLESLKWFCWHDNVFRALRTVQDLEIDLDVEEPHIAQAKLLKAVREFDCYLRANASRIPNYGERRRAGEANDYRRGYPSFTHTNGHDQLAV
jgi:hypothetical protein